jgi:3-isopropylmalate/(R)-2-methylmalate dehydratase large subunit
MAKSLFDKIWDNHCVDTNDSNRTTLYIDRHIIHEVTSAQAFEGLRVAQRKPWRKGSILATPDHQVPTTERERGISAIRDPLARLQVTTLDENCSEYGILKFGLEDHRQGIVHVVGPEQGATLPGMTIVCGDSHTSTHGAFAALAQGIGTSEVEHVLATQCLTQSKPLSMYIQVDDELPPGSTAKDLILYIIGQLGMAGANGHVIEYAGNAIRQLSMEGRMTICNMSIEMGARAGMVAFDTITENYLRGRPFSPQGPLLQKALEHWRTLHSDRDAVFDKQIRLNARDVAPHVTWGTSPDQVVPITGRVPDPDALSDTIQQVEYQRAQKYMGLSSGTPLIGIPIDRVFVGSCTNGRIEDIRSVANLLAGKTIAANIKEAIVVPGSGLVKAQAEQEGLHTIIKAAGVEWRAPGCSMCNAMNPDHLEPDERCASTSNRNFEGRQGHGGRTHLVSPVMAAAAAIAGHLVDARTLNGV